MRPEDTSIRTRAWALDALALIGIAGLIHAYVAGRSPVAWWPIVVIALLGAVHYHRRSRK